MTNPQGYLNDFVTVNTQFSYDDKKSSNKGWETSQYASVQDMFESHLSETNIDINDVKRFGIDTYHLKVGDKIKLHPTKWSKGMTEKHDLDSSSDRDYDFNYIVQDIQITMFNRNPISDGDFPHLKIDIILKRS